MANHHRIALAALVVAAATGASAEGLCTADAWAMAGANGAVSGLVMPAPAAPQEGRAAVGLGFDYWRGGNFLLPDARTQRTSGALGFTTALVPCVEIFGSVGLRSTNLF